MEGDRTLDLRIANATLSQLSYHPEGGEFYRVWGIWHNPDRNARSGIDARKFAPAAAHGLAFTVLAQSIGTQAPMDINPPFGYKDIGPLYKNLKVKLPSAGHLPEFVRATNAVPISYTEFALAARDYPLVFTTTDEGKSFSPVVVIGMSGAENLFLVDGAWDANAYVPAYIRRYPFCMTRVTLNQVEQADRLICVEKEFLSDDGERMFDDQGKALERWQPIEKLLNEYEADLERTREMSSILNDYALLEPFTLQASMRDGGALNLAGMYRIEEKKLEFLNAAQHRNLFRKGIMGRIYAHLLSMDNFGRLMARKNTAAALLKEQGVTAAVPASAPEKAKGAKAEKAR